LSQITSSKLETVMVRRKVPRAPISWRSWLVWTACVALLAAPPALAQPASENPLSEETRQDSPRNQQDEAGPWSVSGGIGFTLDPGTFLVTLGAEYAPDGAAGFSAGPLVQFGVSDNNTIIAPTVNGRYTFDLSDAKDDIARRLSPFVQGGLGFAYIDKERNAPKNDKDEVGFLFNMGAGLEFALSDSVSIGNSILFNVLPVRTARQNFFFSWQFATMRFRF
jgi:hypothetical protein